MRKPLKSDGGSVFLLAIIVVGVLSMIIAASYKTLIPRYRSVYQADSWQEALHGAEAGVDIAVAHLNEFARTTKSTELYPWTTSSWITTDSTYAINGERTLAAAAIPDLSPVSPGDRNELQLSKVAVDVYTREKNPPYNPWYRVRSTARANLPGKWVSADKRDMKLRRMVLANRYGGASDPYPYVERSVDAIVRPVYRFGSAIKTIGHISLGNSNNWLVDSFDSRDTAKSDTGTSAGGVYPNSSAKRQSNGDVSSREKRPTSSPYGPLVDANGATVAGDVSTNGGDDPNTSIHENVASNSGIVQTRIKDDFNEDIPAIEVPKAFTGLPNAVIFNNFPSTGGTATAPIRYVINGGLGAFAIAPPVGSADTYVEIYIRGSLSIGNGNGAAIVIPPKVYATLYVDGNIDFGNGIVNSGSSDSKVATRLMVYGVHSTGTYTASGNAVVTAAIYAPTYGASLNGTVTSTGSVVSNTFSIIGGGNGGFHYDEALSNTDLQGWAVSSYFDDARTDSLKLKQTYNLPY